MQLDFNQFSEFLLDCVQVCDPCLDFMNSRVDGVLSAYYSNAVAEAVLHHILPNMASLMKPILCNVIRFRAMFHVD